MSENFRFAFVILASIVLGSCSSAVTAISGDSHNMVSAEPVQYEFPVSIRKTPESPIEQITLTPLTADAYVDVRQYLGYVLLDSGKKCQQFADRLSAVQRGVDTSFDILTTILSALATAFTPLSTVHALTAGATISTGTKLAIDADVYAKATAALILQEIDRTYYVKVQDYGTKLSARQDVDKIIPTIEVSEIEAIHRKCSLDAAIASLTQTGAVAAATIGAATGAAAGAAATGEAATGAIAGALAGATAGATAAGAPAASQAAAMAGREAGANAGAATPPPPTGAGPRASDSSRGVGASPGRDGRDHRETLLPKNMCTDPAQRAEIAKDKQDLINSINQMNMEQLEKWLKALPTTSSLRNDPQFKIGVDLLPKLKEAHRSPLPAINDFTIGIANSVCTRQQLNEVQSSVSSL